MFSFATPSKGGMFGQQPAQPAQPSTSLFGQPSQPSQPAQSTSLFGQQPAQPSTSLFGQQPAQPAQPSTSLFGQQQPTGLFGAKPATATGSTGLFGQQPAQQSSGMFGQQQQSTGLFGQQQTGMFGGQSLFGKSAAPVAPAQPAVTTIHGLVPPSVNKQAKYDELPLEMKNALDEAEKYIQSQIQHFQTLSKSSIPQVLSGIHQETKQAQNNAKKVRNLIERDMISIEEIRNSVSAEIKNAEMAGRYIGKYVNPHQLSFVSKSDDDIVKYFEKVVLDLQSKLRMYQISINEIEQGITERLSNEKVHPESLKAILVGQNDLFISLSKKVAVLHDQIQVAKQTFDNYKKLYEKPMEIVQDTQIEYTPFSQIASASVSVARTQPNAAPEPATSAFGTGTSAFGSSTGTGLFGASTAPPSTTTSSGLFGQSSTTGSTSGGMFGQPQQQNSSGGMFGQPSATSGGMFGQQQQTTSTGGIFGQQPSTSTGGMFGAGTQRPSFSLSINTNK